MLNINGEDWRVVLVSPTHPALYRGDGSLTIGACDDGTKTIYIKDGLPPWKAKKVLCHELCHACMFSYDVELDIA